VGGRETAEASGAREREGLVVVVSEKERLSKTFRGGASVVFCGGGDDGRYVHDRLQRALGDQRAPISLATMVSW
jgi:hypothetical protein